MMNKSVDDDSAGPKSGAIEGQFSSRSKTANEGYEEYWKIVNKIIIWDKALFFR